MNQVSIPLFFLLPFAFILATQGQSNLETGIALYGETHYQKSATALKLAVAADKKDRLALMFLGAALARTDQKKEALSAFRKGNLEMNASVDFYDKQLKIISKPRPAYSNSARQNLTTGTVTLAVEFQANGSIGLVFPVDSLRDGLTENCIRVANAIKFTPAEKNGSPVTTVRVVKYTFDIY